MDTNDDYIEDSYITPGENSQGNSTLIEDIQTLHISTVSSAGKSQNFNTSIIDSNNLKNSMNISNDSNTSIKSLKRKLKREEEDEILNKKDRKIDYLLFDRETMAARIKMRRDNEEANEKAENKLKDQKVRLGKLHANEALERAKRKFEKYNNSQ